MMQSDSPAAISSDRLRFGAGEWSGALGDLGTFLPLSVALALVCGMDLGAIFLFAGLGCIASGLVFRQPIPVQPMKALAAVAIADTLTPGSIAASGVFMGVFLLTLALSGLLERAARWVPAPVVRGIQAAIGLKLALKAFAWATGVEWSATMLSVSSGLPLVGPDSWLVLVIAVAVLVFGRRAVLALPVLFVAGLGLIALIEPGGHLNATISPPRIGLIQPTGQEWLVGLREASMAQLPLTLLNSVLAVCALSDDLFQGRGVPLRRMALKIGLLNLLATPLGAMPMCHGAGGLAAQHRFGARTGGSVLILGSGLLVVGLLFGGGLGELLNLYPKSILAVMISLAGWLLASKAFGTRGSANWVVLAATVLGIIAINTAVGFLLGMGVAYVVRFWRRFKRLPPDSGE